MGSKKNKKSKKGKNVHKTENKSITSKKRKMEEKTKVFVILVVVLTIVLFACFNLYDIIKDCINGSISETISGYLRDFFYSSILTTIAAVVNVIVFGFKK